MSKDATTPPPLRENKPRFNEFFRDLMKDKELTGNRLAERLKVSRSTVSFWLTTNRWSRNLFRQACEAVGVAEKLELQEFGHAHVKERFEIAFKVEAKDTKNARADPLAVHFADVDKALPSSRRKMDNLSQRLISVLGQMKEGNLVIVFSGTVLPFILRTADPVGIHTLAALRRGALLCVIAPEKMAEPEEDYWQRLSDYGFKDLETAAGFDKQLEFFRAWAEREYERTGIRDADVRKYLYDRFQLIHVPHSPWFCPGFTFSLFVDFTDAANLGFRSAMRAPEDAFGSWAVFPALPNERIETRMCQAAAKHLAYHLERPRDTPLPGEFTKSLRLMRAVVSRDFRKIEELKPKVF